MVNVLGVLGGILGCLFIVCLELYQKSKITRDYKRMITFENSTIFFGFFSFMTLLIAVLLM